MDNIVELSVLFIICSFLGFIYELIVTYIYTHKIYSHSMFHIPFLPIYGFGSILIILFLDKYKHNFIKFSILSFLLTGLFEYISGLGLLKIFKIRLWDYTKYIGNINGLVCPLSAFCFTIDSIIITYFLYPFVKNMIATLKK